MESQHCSLLRTAKESSHCLQKLENSLLVKLITIYPINYHIQFNSIHFDLFIYLFMIDTCKDLTVIVSAPLMMGACEVIRSKNVKLMLNYTVQTLIFDNCESKFEYLLQNYLFLCSLFGINSLKKYLY